MPSQSFLLIFFYKTIHSSGALPLSSGQRRCDKCHISVSQIQQMACHQSSDHCIVLVDRVYCRCLFFITDNNKGNPPCQFLYLFLKVRMRITCIDDSLRVHRADHTQIFFFQPRISLCVAGKNAIPLLIGNRFNSLKKQYIIRTGQRRTQYNDQFFFSCVAFVFAMRQFIAQLSGCTFYLFQRFRIIETVACETPAFSATCEEVAFFFANILSLFLLSA